MTAKFNQKPPVEEKNIEQPKEPQPDSDNLKILKINTGGAPNLSEVKETVRENFATIT